MTKHVRVWLAGLTVVAVAGLVSQAPRSAAGEGKEFAKTVEKIAAAIKQGNKDEAKKIAEKAAKDAEEIHEVMHLFRPRKKGGVGFGPKALAKSDGIEAKLQEISRDAPSGVAKDAEAYETMGYTLAALAEITHVMAPERDMGKKTRKDWIRWTEDMRDGGLAIAKAAKTGSAAEVKTGATKAYGSCTACHAVYR